MSELAHIPAIPEASYEQPPASTLRRRFIAAALSALIPGAGQLFLGKRRTGVVLLIALAAVSSGFWPQRLPRSYHALLLMILAGVLLWLFAICDALFGKDRVSRSRLSKWWLLAALPAHYIGFNIFFTSLLFASGFRPVRSAASSMEPMIKRDERFVADMNYYRFTAPHRGDLALLRTQDGLVVKRIAAVPGDIIEGKERQTLLNGQLQNEPFVHHKFPIGTDPLLDTFGPVVVPNGKYFVMGDNRDISLDSRTPSFGLVDAQSIVGKPLYVYHFRGKPLSRELN